MIASTIVPSTIGAQIALEFAVDGRCIDRDALQVREARVAGSEIVDKRTPGALICRSAGTPAFEELKLRKRLAAAP